MASSPFAGRVAALQRKIAEVDLDALFVSDLINVRYLCGFKGTYGILIVDRKNAHFITDGRYAEIAEGIVQGADITIRPLSDIDAYFKDIFRKFDFDRLGFEGTLSVDEHDKLKTWTRPAKSKLIKASGLVQALRQVKDEGEIQTIRKAAKLADRMMEVAFDALSPGKSETEISLLIRRAAEDFGGEGESFPNIVAGGPNSSRPHHRPQKRRLRIGDMVTLDLGGIVDGYCSDMTRNPVIGKLSKKFEEIYELCLEAQSAAVKACTAGVGGAELDAVARDIIASRGYGEYYNHGLGHGVGLEIHEGPRLAKSSKDVLVAGNVVTIEPGIYIPGFGGVRIEDLLVVTDGKPKILSKTPKNLTVLESK